jgi:hypothetical protein
VSEGPVMPATTIKTSMSRERRGSYVTGGAGTCAGTTAFSLIRVSPLVRLKPIPKIFLVLFWVLAIPTGTKITCSYQNDFGRTRKSTNIAEILVAIQNVTNTIYDVI